MQAIYLLSQDAFESVYAPEIRARMARGAEFRLPRLDGESLAQHAGGLADVEVAFSGWGCPVFDEATLARLPRLRAVFYAAGSVRALATDAFWRREIVLTSSWAANAVPVAEFTLAQIVFCLKDVWRHVLALRRERRCLRNAAEVTGTCGATVGLIGLGMIGRLVCERLKAYDLRVLAYDPFATAADATTLGAELASLDDLFRRSDVVSLHAPALETTRGMIEGRHFRLMRPRACFLNTARGSLVREPEMIAALHERPDLTAVLDVTDPEPAPAGSPLFDMPNVVLTPHLAGAMGNECHRLAVYAAEEFERWLRGEPLRWQITPERLAHMA